MSEKRGYPNPDYTEEDLIQDPVEVKEEITIDETVIISPEKFEELCSKAAALDILTAHIKKTGKVDDDIVHAVTGTTDIKVENKASDYFNWWCEARNRAEGLQKTVEDLKNRIAELEAGKDE